MDSIPLERGTSRLAIDVGNVISQHDSDMGDLASFIGSNDNITPTKECAEACRILVEMFGKENTFILSKCKHNMQIATTQLLQRSIEGGPSFLQHTTIIPRNVIFCTKRSGGEGKVQFVPLDPTKDKRGFRVAAGDVGKGAVARTLKLTHMIDDRDDCLLSFSVEGHLLNNVSKSRTMAGALIQFGHHASHPTEERVGSFLAKNYNGLLSSKESKHLACIVQSQWRVAENWKDVLRIFDVEQAQCHGYSPMDE